MRVSILGYLVYKLVAMTHVRHITSTRIIQHFVRVFEQYGMIKFFERRAVVPHIFVGVRDEETRDLLVSKLDNHTLDRRRVDVLKVTVVPNQV